MANYSVVVVGAESRREPCKMLNLTEIRATTSSHPKAASSDPTGMHQVPVGWGVCFRGSLRGLQWTPSLSRAGERTSGRCWTEEGDLNGRDGCL